MNKMVCLFALFLILLSPASANDRTREGNVTSINLDRCIKGLKENGFAEKFNSISQLDRTRIIVYERRKEETTLSCRIGLDLSGNPEHIRFDAMIPRTAGRSEEEMRTILGSSCGFLYTVADTIFPEFIKGRKDAVKAMKEVPSIEVGRYSGEFVMNNGWKAFSSRRGDMAWFGFVKINREKRQVFEELTTKIPSPANDAPSSVPLKNRIHFMDVTTTSLKMTFHDRGKAMGTMQVIKGRYDLELVVYPENHQPTTITLQPENKVTYGTAALDDNGNDDLFIVAYGGGTGVGHVSLILLNPRLLEALVLTLEWDNQKTEVLPRLYRSSNFLDPRLAPERKFLEKIKYEYKYRTATDVEKKQDDPKYAYYFWKKDNGKTIDGPLFFRKYKGLLPSGVALTTH